MTADCTAHNLLPPFPTQSLRLGICSSGIGSTKVENHAHAVALHPMFYNFVRIHKTLRVTPAMAAGVADRLLEIADIAKLVEDAEAKPTKRGPYKRRTGSAQ